MFHCFINDITLFSFSKTPFVCATNQKNGKHFQLIKNKVVIVEA